MVTGGEDANARQKRWYVPSLSHMLIMDKFRCKKRMYGINRNTAKIRVTFLGSCVVDREHALV